VIYYNGVSLVHEKYTKNTLEDKDDFFISDSIFMVKYLQGKKGDHILFAKSGEIFLNKILTEKSDEVGFNEIELKCQTPLELRLYSHVEFLDEDMLLLFSDQVIQKGYIINGDTLILQNDFEFQNSIVEFKKK